jgi:hypothetical protein
MADPIPFVLAGVVVSWDPVPRYPVCWLRSPGRGAGRGRRSARPVATCHGHRPSTEARRRRALGGDEDRGASARILTSRRRGPRSDGPPPTVRLPNCHHLATGTIHTVYQVPLSAAPSRVWRAAFVRPPARLGHAPFSPAGIDLQGAAIIFRAAPSRVQEWLRWIDRWVAYANSIVEE